MRRLNLAVWCALLFVAFANEETHTNSSVPYEPRMYSIATKNDKIDFPEYKTNGNTTEDDSANYELHENSTRNGHEVRYEFQGHSTKSDEENDNRGPLYEVDVNNTAKINYENGSWWYEGRTNSSGEDNENEDFTRYRITSDTACTNACIPICCPLGERYVPSTQKCVPAKGRFTFPDVYESIDSLQSDKRLDEVFQFVVRDPCKKTGRYLLNAKDYPTTDEYKFLTNGSLYHPFYNKYILPKVYCLALVQDTYEVTVCFVQRNNTPTVVPDPLASHVPVGIIMSLPFLLITFVVYCVLPDLQNMHGYTLRGYVSTLFVAYLFLSVMQLTPQEKISDHVCIAAAFIIHFSFLASFFWLNVMCLDIWWTFGGFRSLQGSVRQREKKKFIIYSIYAWGTASILTIVCAIMDFVPNLPDYLIRPHFGSERCWFSTNTAKAVYFYGPISVTVVCNIFLFISTAVKIIRHKKETAAQLRGSESRCHDDNKQWFNLYLKLFIVMGINWSMEITSWVFKDAPQYVWYLTDLTNTLQGLIIFIIFVWKEKIKRLLLKRFGCQDRGIFSRNSTRSGCHSTASRSCTTSFGAIQLQEKISPSTQTNCRTKSTFDETRRD